MSTPHGTRAPLAAVAVAALTALCAGTFTQLQPTFQTVFVTVSVGSAGSTSTGTAFMPASFAMAQTIALSLPGQSPSPGAATIPLAVTVPPTGTFMLTVNTSGTVRLTVSGGHATAAMAQVIVLDTRNTFPGWSVTGQDGTWIGSGSAHGASMTGDQLGWTPASDTAPLPQGVTVGAAVAPASPGLGSNGAVLASAIPGLHSGYGTVALGAGLDLLIPPGQAAGDYTSGLTITAIATRL
jgi:hypothetical protein